MLDIRGKMVVGECNTSPLGASISMEGKDMERGIPDLTPEETAMVRQVEHSEHVNVAFALRYLHWSKARGSMLDAIAKQGQQLTLVGKVSEGQAWLNALPYDYEEEWKE